MDIEQDFHSQNNNDNLVLTDAEQQKQQHLTNNNESALLRGWNNSSRIFRVSRASGGKDRHSKVLTSKGLRDRRVRLSVSTAIQFYDLQDRLGYDQPSKAVEWLIKAAADSIAELPSLNGPFPDCTGIVEQNQTQNQNQNLSASSTSETSKGSGLSLTQSDVRVNQRVVARERAKEKESSEQQQVVNAGQRIRSPISTSSTATFTELLTGGQSGSSPNNNSSVPVMDYFMANAARGRSNANAHAAACLFLGQSHNMPPAFHLTNGNHHQHNQEQFSFVQQNLIESGNEHQYDLNFTISSTSSPSGFNNRGTLQSNSHSTMHHNHLQRYSMEGSNNVPAAAAAAFFMATSAAAAAANNLESNTNQHHHFSTGLDGSLHLYYGDHKNKGGKN